MAEKTSCCTNNPEAETLNAQAMRNTLATK
jgi:hypothetical protein